jgi:hypothetical protein
MFKRRSIALAAAGVVLAGGGAVWAQLDENVTLPMDHRAIEYTSAPAQDRAAMLSRRLASGELRLDYDQEFGYLPALLKALDVPVSSQTLVFSKTSFQAARITPSSPRAIYHSDDTFVGYVRGGDVLELASVDPRQGVVFYAVDQSPAKARIDRSGECYLCHVGSVTLGVPGILVRSVYVYRTGYALKDGGFLTDYRSPIKQRWGGWYVSGTSGGQNHMGNQIVDDRDNPQLNPAKGTNITDLSKLIDTARYLRPSSDIVSLMTLEHQTRLTNLLTRLGWETRIGKDERQTAGTVEETVRALLFAGEAPLTEPIAGTSTYATEFSRVGPRDRRGRSLRDFDLKRRLFRYPCSYLIYSAQFDALPPAAKARVTARLSEILAGGGGNDYAYLSAADRQAIAEILRDTKAGLLPGAMQGAALRAGQN